MSEREGRRQVDMPLADRQTRRKEPDRREEGRAVGSEEKRHGHKQNRITEEQTSTE